ncbi:MAG TPA: hypothetical protein VN541_20985 [Tepidisphaeraceae bacterium]|nr:hypothetical protein [Tepidisphaeraceae bacterium]
MRRRWILIAGATFIVLAYWLALKDGQAFRTRDAIDPVLDWRTPIYFGSDHLYVFGDEVRYLAASLVCLFLGFAVLGFWAMNPSQLHRRLRGRAGLCRECGYNLTGNTSGVCPECGAVIAPPATRRPAPDHS